MTKNVHLLLLLLLSWQLTACLKKGPVTAPGDTADRISKVDDMVRSYMSSNKVPGLSLAITRNGKLVYAKGYGFANQESAEKVTTTTRFRISSITKSITAAAVMKLMEEGRINLDAKVFGNGAILGNDFGSQPYGRYITDITVRHCLQHHTGGWSNNSSDPTSLNQSMNANQLITWILNNRPLDVAPGTAYAYSNVGFMILGRVIEKITGMNYDQYVKDHILKPAGITNMEIGGNTLADRKPNEATYYGVGTENPYNTNFARRDANGGWIATATDLARLFVHMDGLSTVPDLLSPVTMQTMVTPSFTYQGYANGMYVSGSKWFHGGSYSGSRSHWMRTGSGFCGVVYVNTSAPGLQELLEQIISSGDIRWPDTDLF